MLLESPLVNYNSISINGKEITFDTDTCRVSFNPPFNEIKVSMAPTNCSLSYYEVRVTEASEPYDIEVGNLAHWTTNIALNKTYSFIIPVNSTLFNKGNGMYRISFYAKSAIDGSWDVAYLLFTVDGFYLVAEDGGELGVLTTREAPTNN